MAEVVKVNGTPVRTNGLYPRTVPGPDGTPLHEVSLMVIVRGSQAHRGFLALIAQEQVSFEFGGGQPFDATIVATTHETSGGGSDAAYRHDLTLRETTDSAVRRLAAAEASRAVAAAAADALPPATSDRFSEDDADDASDDHFGKVTLTTSSAAWGTAFRQLTEPRSTEPAPPPPEPLAPAELAGVEAVLVGLRLEALIDALDRSGAVRRSTIDDGFLRLISERFVSEATPVVGEDVARRVVKDLLEG